MSPPALRRFRAERLLRQEFQALQGTVLATVRGRLRARGASLDPADLEACYAQAWQGLYMEMLEGREIANPTGWLVLVTFRRAIDEQRARARQRRDGEARVGCVRDARTLDEPALEGAQECDLAAGLDDRVRLRQLWEGLRGRLNAREREAAVLCYLQGMSRSEAAARMGLSEARMRKLMEGRGDGRPGVAGKMGALLETIRRGGWCEEQGSLMRALAYGMLDPEGERHQLAIMHQSECPACRAYVVSLRGLAAVLPPVLLPWGLGAAALAQIGRRAVGTASAGGGGSAGSAGAGTSVQVARVGGALSASGAGAGGGGWLLAGGPLGAKLAVGCLLALGVGAGCLALDAPPEHERIAVHAQRPAPTRHALLDGAQSAAIPRPIDTPSPAAAERDSRQAASRARLAAASLAGREFGPEQDLEAGDARSVALARGRAPTAASASAREPAPEAVAPPHASGSSAAPTAARGQSGSTGAAGGATAAEREFAPG